LEPQSSIGGRNLRRCVSISVPIVVKVDRKCRRNVCAEGIVRRHGLDQLFEDVSPLEVGLVRGTLLLPPQDREELGPSLEEATTLADGLIGAVELGGPGAATIGQKTAVALGSHIGLFVVG
jgi:hypothetical protein